MNHLSNVLENIDRPYYFGCGGIGDFLLLMSTFYDDVRNGEVDVVFLANNIKPIVGITRNTEFSWFTKINRFWLLPKNSVRLDETVWNELTSDSRCLGTGVTPKGFNYVKDWIECGKSNVFSYYGVRPRTEFAQCGTPPSPYLVIQPFGGSDDPTKKKEISKSELSYIIRSNIDNYERIFILGSKSECDKVNKLLSDDVTYISDIQVAMQIACNATLFIGTDSWGKTMAKLAGRETIVYKNKFPGLSPQDMFNHHTDPGDYVFLHNWGFEMREDPYGEEYWN